MELYIIRHLPTPWNIEGRLQGSADISILTPGDHVLSEIIENKKKLNELSFDMILVSNLKRTQETALLYSIDNFEVEPLIGELDFGVYEGVQKQQMLVDLGKDWFDNVLLVELGEKMTDFESRLRLFLAKYMSCDRILVFSHGAVMRGMIALHQNKSIRKMNNIHVRNNELVILTFDEY